MVSLLKKEYVSQRSGVGGFSSDTIMHFDGEYIFERGLTIFPHHDIC
jgi:hypothetical protein